MANPETTLTNRIKRALDRHAESQRQEIYYFKHHGSEFATAGVPDLIVCYRGAFVALEVKTPQNIKGPTDNQARHIRRIRSAGGIAAVVRSPKAAVQLLEKVDNAQI